MPTLNFEEYLEGKQLWGDDFIDSEIESWFADEKNGYAELGAKNKDQYVYSYAALNEYHGFRFLPSRKFNDILGVGSAWGHELLPVLSTAVNVSILEPSDTYVQDKIFGKPVTYLKPGPKGSLPCPDNSFDLITCFSVLHHIPNISYVLSDMTRCLRKGGILLLHEPIVSMGDWRKPRKGLTTRERGIPLKLFRDMISRSGLRIIKESYCMFPLTSRLNLFIKKPAYNSRIAVLVDHFLATLFSLNYSYHARNFIQKLRPIDVFYVLTKD